MARSHYKIRSGILVKGITSYPSDAEEGDLVYRSDLFKYSIYRNGNWADFLDDRLLQVMTSSDAASTGANATLAAPTTPFVRLTNGSLSSVNMIPAGVDGQIVTISNVTGTVVLINDETGATAANRIKTGNAKPITMKSDSSITLIYDNTSSRWRVISGIGSGSGNANELLERLKDSLDDSPYEYLTENIFANKQQTEIASATATYDLANDLYSFAASTAQNIVSIESFDSDFLALGEDIGSLDVYSFWNSSTDLDSTAVHQISKDGGTTYQTISMTEIGSSGDTLKGTYRFQGTGYTPEPGAVLQSAVFNSGLLTFNIASGIKKISQPIVIASATKIQSFTAQFSRVGTPLGFLSMVLIKDDGTGKPSTNAADEISSAGSLSISGLSWSADVATATWSFSAILPAGTYHAVVTPDASYVYSAGVTELKWRQRTSAPTPYSTTYSGAGPWSIDTGYQVVHSFSGFALSLKLKITSSVTAGIKKLAGYGILYRLASGSPVTGVENLQTFRITTNTSNFALTNFTPDIDLLRVYCLQTGQVFIGGDGSFNLNGNTVQFPTNTFAAASTSNPLTLVFEQRQGYSFDNSDKNAGLLADNRLGSLTASLDRSVAGKGIILRAAVGAGSLSNKRCEIWLDSYGAIQISSLE